MAFQFFLQSSIAPIFTVLLTDFHLQATQVAIISSAFFYTYVAMQIIVGLLLDHCNQRLLLSAACALLSVGCICFSMTNSFWLAVLSRMLMGFGASFAFVGMLTVVRDWFAVRYFALMISLAELLGLAVTVLGNFLFSYAVITIGWRAAMLGCGILAMIIVVILLLFLRPSPQNSLQNDLSFKQLWKNISCSFHNQQVWISGIYGGFMMSVVTVFIALWGIPFLQHVYHFSLIMSNVVVMLAMLGVGIGSPLYGWLSNYYRCKTLMIFGSIATFIFLSAFFYIPNLSLFELSILSFATGFSTATYLLAFTHVKRNVPEFTLGTAMGATNLLIMMMPILLQPLIGSIVVYYQSQGVALAYRHGLSILPTVIIIAGILGLALRDHPSFEGAVIGESSV
ncbi:MAG: MFS transporter [Legionellales bacterium]|nr:MFS transporter [Legionellales bacterium]